MGSVGQDGQMLLLCVNFTDAVIRKHYYTHSAQTYYHYESGNNSANINNHYNHTFMFPYYVAGSVK